MDVPWIDDLGLTLGHWAILGVAVIAFIVTFSAVRRLSRRRIVAKAFAMPPIDLAALSKEPPPPGPPVLEFYNVPVRLAGVVLAPVGRVGDLPDQMHLPDVADSILPGLDRVVAAHKSAVFTWPRQLSPRGFAHAFFQRAPSAGEHGEKTVWSAVAGVFRHNDEPVMAGLILRAESPNRHGTYIMEHENQWLGILRVRVGG